MRTLTSDPTGMPALGILYPSPSLAELGDPLPVPEGEATLNHALARARKATRTAS